MRNECRAACGEDEGWKELDGGSRRGLALRRRSVGNHIRAAELVARGSQGGRDIQHLGNARAKENWRVA